VTLEARLVAVLLAATVGAAPTVLRLDVPVIRQAPERCGPAALEMVMRYYGAGPAALAEAGRAYDPTLRGSLITDLAECARRAGFAADVVTLTPDSLASWLARGVPPILLIHSGLGPIAVGHYAVLVGWDPVRRRYALHDGGPSTREVGAASLTRRWRGGGFQALLVHQAPGLAGGGAQRSGPP